jgi:hypothetical protein
MIDDIKKQLHLFFPGQAFPVSDIETGLDKGDILTEKEKILPFLQTALFDEKVLEVELDSMPRVYFSRLKDDFSEFIDDEDDPVFLDEEDYNQGDYLTLMSHIVTLPLEPGLGNLYLRHSRCIVLRMFTNTFAVELATTFEKLTTIGNLPVLRLSFPTLARKIHNAREFRVNDPESLDFIVNIEIKEGLPELKMTPVEVSVKGMGFSASKAEQKLFIPGETHSLKLYVNDELLAVLNGTVRQLSKVRKKAGIEYICWMEFDLATRTLAAVIESTVASVQRAHLKDLAEKSDASGIHLIA